MTSGRLITLTANRAGAPDGLSHQQISVVAANIDLGPSPPAVDVFSYGLRDSACAATMWSTTSHSSAGADADLDFIRPPSHPSLGRPNGPCAPLARPEDAILLIAFMEHLNGSPSVVRALVLRTLRDALQWHAGIGRTALVATLIEVMNRTIDFANGGPNFCSAIELGLTARDLRRIEARGYLILDRPFVGYGGRYMVRMLIYKEIQDCEFAEYVVRNREKRDRNIASALV